jgi:LacI family transcriptional regulator
MDVTNNRRKSSIGRGIERRISRISRRATIDDVAQLAGVSIKTVSRVFNQAPNVRGTTREKVFAAAEDLHYKPNLSARQLASNRTFVIGMLYDNPNSEYVTEVQCGALQACREHSYNLLIHPCRTDSPGLFREVIELHGQVDGLIVLQPLSDLEELNQLLDENHIKCVRISQRPVDGFPWISVNDANAAEEMTEHLLELGHRRIGFIVGHPDHGQSHDRLTGYRNALKKHGVDFDESLVEQGRFDFESGYLCSQKLLSLTPPPTAIFASNDEMALAVLSAAHESGLDVPRELSIAGFDDSLSARHVWPRLTTVRQPIAEVARLAADELIKRMQVWPGDTPHHCLQAELVLRASTASPAITEHRVFRRKEHQ